MIAHFITASFTLFLYFFILTLFQVFLEEFINGLERDDIHLVVEVRVNGARNGEEFLIVPFSFLNASWLK